jgi:glycine/serine hydroxymethyltransferase
MDVDDMRKIVGWIDEAVNNVHNKKRLEDIRQQVKNLCLKKPIPTL